MKDKTPNDLIARLNPLFVDDSVGKHAASLQSFRAELDTELPADYLQFLRQDGRTLFVEDNHVVADGFSPSLQIGLNCLFGLQEKSPNLFTANETYAGRIPPGLIVIGDSNGGGDLICLDIEGRSAGSVFFWDHDSELNEDGNPNEFYSNTILLAGSFTLFLESLRLNPELTSRSNVVNASLRF